MGDVIPFHPRTKAGCYSNEGLEVLKGMEPIRRRPTAPWLGEPSQTLNGELRHLVGGFQDIEAAIRQSNLLEPGLRDLEFNTHPNSALSVEFLHPVHSCRDTFVIKLSMDDAVADAIASLRTSGFTVTTAHRELLAKKASGELTSAQVKRAMLDSVAAPKSAED